MIFKYSASEQKQLNEISKHFEKLIAKKKEEIRNLRDEDDVPKEPERPKTMSDEDREAWNKKIKENFDKWESKGSPEWRQARRELLALQMQQSEALRLFSYEAERKRFSKLGGDRTKILNNAGEQAKEIIEESFNYYQQIKESGRRPEDGEEIEEFSARDLRVDEENNIYLDARQMIYEIKEALHLHYDSLKYDKEALSALDDIIVNAVAKSPHVSNSAGNVFGNAIANKASEIVVVTAKKPKNFITPIDKVSNNAFTGVFSNKTVGVEVIKKAKSQKPIYTMVSIDTTELEGVTIKGRKELTQFDREVHDAIVTLYTEGGNVYITVNMIYQTMTGKISAHCSPKQAEAISDSITKLMYSRVIIDASQEAEKYNLARSKYDSNVINAKRVTISLNGQTVEAIKILDTPLLLDYSQQKKQIGRFDVKLLDTPNNKNEETIILEGYLRRRILSMKGTSKLSPTILYESIYEMLDLSNIKSDSARRNKTQKIRETVKKTLDYYKREDVGFIKGYVENTHKGDKNRKVSVTIRF